MKNRKKILMSSLVMLIVATVALSTTTYAWFTTGSKGTIDTFNFTANSASGIQFSVDAQTWKSTIVSSDISTQVASDTQSGTAQYGSIFVDNSSFLPLSTTANTIAKASGSEDGKLVLYQAVAGTDGGLTTSASASGYYVFNIYVNNLAETAKNLTLTTVAVGDVVDSTANPAIKDKDTSTAVRVAFVDQGSITKNGDAATVKANVIGAKTNAATDVKILEPNSETHTTYATTYLSSYLPQDGADPYYGVKAADTVATTNIADGFIQSTSTVVEAVTTFDDLTTNVALLDANSITKLTVYVWLEGQDIDCTNDVASGKVSIQLGFTAADVTQQP